jgi:hypothetical protein
MFHEMAAHCMRQINRNCVSNLPCHGMQISGEFKGIIKTLETGGFPNAYGPVLFRMPESSVRIANTASR